MRRLSRSLYAQVLLAVLLGALLGHFRPAFGASLKPLGDAFIKLVKMLIAPIVFTTVVTGIAKMGDLKKVGRVGLKGLVYFEILTTLALAIGLVVGNLFKPGAGMNVERRLARRLVHRRRTRAPGQHLSTVDFLMNVIPKDVADAFAKGDILQVLLFSMLFGVALAALKEKGRSSCASSTTSRRCSSGSSGSSCASRRSARSARWRSRSATTGSARSLSLGKLMGTFYATSLLFVLLVLGARAAALRPRDPASSCGTSRRRSSSSSARPRPSPPCRSS